MFRALTLVTGLLLGPATAHSSIVAMHTDAVAAQVRPTWSLTRTQFLGFSDTGEVLTRHFDDPEIKLLDPRTGQITHDIRFPEAGQNMGVVATSGDLRNQAWLNRAGDVLFIRTPTGRHALGQSGLRGTQALTFSPDGQTLAALNVNGYVQLWDVAAGRRRATLTLHSQPAGLAFDPRRPLLMVNERGQSGNGESSVTVWDVATGQPRGALPGFHGTLRPFVFAPSGELIVPDRYSVGRVRFGLSDTGDLGLSRLTFPTYTETCPRGAPWKTCARGVSGASFSADGTRALLNVGLGEHSGALLYDLPGGRLLQVIPAADSVVTLSPGGQTLILHRFTGDLQGAVLPE